MYCAPSLKRRRELEAKEVEDWWQHVEAGGSYNVEKTKKKKKKKKAKRPVTPSPEVHRDRRGRGGGGDDSDEEDGYGRGPPKIRPGPTRGTWMVSF